MNPKIEKWYADKKLPVDRIIDIGAKRFGITDRAAIVVAIEEEYAHRIQPRKIPLRDIDIAWSVWNRARKIISQNRIQEASEKFGADQARIEELTDNLNDCTSKFNALLSRFEETVNKEVHKRLLKDRIFYWATIGLMLAYVLWFSGVFETWKV